eukprot:NODE_2015_length_2311_cov_8.223443.p1 GENE.NODE_2015_length_2311_cov_8.223443~~NODE_2015_length_2311_cov_8.223443.p1  ORF type:complete len:642 (+),score=120.29 NODE_2015_length_2311_cov_8.223443:99-1928(+)
MAAAIVAMPGMVSSYAAAKRTVAEPMRSGDSARGLAYTVRLETSVGVIDVIVRPDWSPHGAQRFLELASAGDLNDLTFYRAVKGCLVQFGLPSKRQWPPIPDDPPVGVPFLLGAVSFAAVGSDTRKSTLFICIGDMSECLGQSSWETPIGAVTEPSLDVLDRIETRYGDIAEFGGTGPETARIVTEGSSYLREHFPALSRIQRASPLDWCPAEDIDLPLGVVLPDASAEVSAFETTVEIGLVQAPAVEAMTDSFGSAALAAKDAAGAHAQQAEQLARQAAAAADRAAHARLPEQVLLAKQAAEAAAEAAISAAEAARAAREKHVEITAELVSALHRAAYKAPSHCVAVQTEQNPMAASCIGGPGAVSYDSYAVAVPPATTTSSPAVAGPGPHTGSAPAAAAPPRRAALDALRTATPAAPQSGSATPPQRQARQVVPSQVKSFAIEGGTIPAPLAPPTQGRVIVPPQPPKQVVPASTVVAAAADTRGGQVFQACWPPKATATHCGGRPPLLQPQALAPQPPPGAVLQPKMAVTINNHAPGPQLRAAPPLAKQQEKAWGAACGPSAPPPVKLQTLTQAVGRPVRPPFTQEINVPGAPSAVQLALPKAAARR